MDALGEDLAKRRTQWTGIATIITTLFAVMVEGSVIFRIWIKPLAGHRGFLFYWTPAATLFPLLLCLSLQRAVRKAVKSGDMSLKMAYRIEVFAVIMVLITYQTMYDLMSLIS
jgi:hypothetical protein